MCINMFKKTAQATAIVGIAQQGRESLGSSFFRASTAVFSDKDRLSPAPGVVFGDSDSDAANSVVDHVPDVRQLGVDHVQNVGHLGVDHVPDVRQLGVDHVQNVDHLVVDHDPDVGDPVVNAGNRMKLFVCLCSLIASEKCFSINREKILMCATPFLTCKDCS